MQWTAVMLLLWILPTVAPAQSQAPSRIAPEARFDLYGTPEVVALHQPELVKGLGTVNRIGWMKRADQTRAFTTSFPIARFAPTEITLRFIPQGDGVVTIALLGYYEKIPGEKDGLFQAEVSWESFDLEGAALAPEARSLLKLPVRSWFRQRYELTMQVNRETPVTLRISARAVSPPGTEDLAPLEGESTPAARTAKLLNRGVTLTGAPEGARKPAFELPAAGEDLEHIHREGFDHVRLPILWHLLVGKGPEFRLSPDLLARIDLVVAEAAKHELAVVLSWRGFEAFHHNPAAELQRFLAVWRQVAEHYADFPATLAFELLSPADNQADTLTLNSAYAQAIQDIRKFSAVRTILCSPGRFGHPAELIRLLPPPGENNLIVSLSSREPEQFTQQAIGSPSSIRLSGIQFPGPPSTPLPPESLAGLDFNLREWAARYQAWPADRNPSGPRVIQDLAQWARRWSEHYRRPVYFAELGVDSRIDPRSRSRFYASWRGALSEAGLGWAVADWNQAQRYWDSKAKQPATGLREALFPERVVGTSVLENRDSLQNALRQLDGLRTQIEDAQRQSSNELGKLRLRAADAQLQARETHELARWLMAGLIALTLFVLGGMFLRRRSNINLLPALREVGPAGSGDPAATSLFPQLPQTVKDRFLLRLLLDRREHVALRDCATQELAALEQRLAQVHAPIQVRLTAYEQRIQELEAELQQMGEQNRELIETKIALTKQRLATARSTTPNEWN